MNRKEAARERRHRRLRKKVLGTAERPRLSVHKSLKNVYAQVVDDTRGHTIVSVGTRDKDFKDEAGHKGNVKTARKVGMVLAAKAVAGGIRKVVFDRGGYRYHGCIKALAEGAREGGLEF